MHVFTQNGFEFKEAEGGELLLSGVPYSKNTSFGKADVQELAQLLMEDHGTVQKDIAQGSQRASVNVSEKLPRPTRQFSDLLLPFSRSFAQYYGKPPIYDYTYFFLDFAISALKHYASRGLSVELLGSKFCSYVLYACCACRWQADFWIK